MSERLLVIDCATPALSVALFAGETLLAARHETLGRGHAEALLPTIAALPDGGRAEAILVDLGPGSFTGVRVGLAAARALGFAWQVPVHGYVCHALVAAMVQADAAPPSAFPVVMIGGHGELFWARTDAPIGPDAVHSTPIAALAAQLDDPVIYGSGAQILCDTRGTGEAVAILPDARRALLLPAAQRSLPPTPVYGRGADAQPMAKFTPSSASPAG